MAKMLALARVVGGLPDVGDLHFSGSVFVDQIGGWGGLLISGSNAELVAINALPQVIGLVAVTDSGNVRWAELDGNCPAALRTRLNTRLTALGMPTIPTGRTYRQVVMAIFKRLNARFDLSIFDVADVVEEQTKEPIK